ncbi:MAG TPA: polysaccharide deacetylase family protein [Vicinamibacterales bacterium]|nr:polysaccharide deacetylase family protein [Vicinamibacterales bacterium]
MKQTFLRVMRASGLFATFRRANQRKILILTYHRFSRRPREGFTQADTLAQQLDYLNAHYTIVRLSDVAKHLLDGDSLPTAPAVITIDDGYDDAYEIAFPVLQRSRAPATLFAATDFIDGKGWLWTDKLRYVATKVRGTAVHLDADRLNAELKRLPDDERERRIADISTHAGVAPPPDPSADYRALTWDQAREMANSGVEFGSHTVTHPILPHVGARQLAYELQQSRDRLERMLDREVSLFCYPNGDYNVEVREAVARAGYRLAVSTHVGLNDRTSDPLALRRVHTERDFTHFIQSTSGFEQFKHGLRTTLDRPATCS